jgi:DNA mismatch repair ATPase MutS
MPLPEAYQEAKRRHPDMLLLFSERHSYWTYGADAEAVKRVGGAAVGFQPGTSSAPAVANLASGALERILAALIRAGHRVAVCDPVK